VSDLNLYWNELSGTIPADIANMTNLNGLALANNQLTGAIPPELGSMTNLTLLDIHGNQLTGSIPSELRNLIHLEKLYLEYNQLTGKIPAGLEQLTYLNDLGLSNNQLEGEILAELGNLTNLVYIGLEDNNFTGGIPASFGNLPYLNVFFTQNNNLSGCYDANLKNVCNLDGMFTISEGNNLDTTWEDFCNTGAGACAPQLPCRQSDSLALVALYDATTGLTWDLAQPISTWQGITLNADGCVERIQLDAALTGGTIPGELGNIENILEIDLEDCNLTGTIPSELGNLQNLVELDLEGNNLTGSIPVNLASLPNLGELVLIENQLSGCYDIGLQPLCNISSANNQISDSNNFDAAWSDFCNAGAGACNDCRTQDSLTLLIVYSSLNGAYFDVNQPINTWQGVTLNTNGCVSGIQLSDEISGGTIVPEIGNLSKLEGLNLTENRITGTIPPEIGNLSNLKYLGLDENNLTGPIPPELGSLTQLLQLGLQDNFLTGGIPAELANLSALQALTVYDNDLSGCYPPELQLFCNIAAYLDISHKNSFDANWDSFCNTGLGTCAPSESCRERDSLILVEFYVANGFGIPNGAINTWSSVTLTVEGCVERLIFPEEGGVTTLTPGLGGLGELEYLDIQENSISSPIPPEFGNLSNLTDLDLSENYISGEIPKELGNLTNLSYLDLWDNDISGSIPPELGSLTNLAYLGLHLNNLTGTIPAELANLTNLNYLFLEHNNLSGSTPPELGNLTSLLEINVSSNNLSGSIPPELGNLTNLGVLNLSANNLSGSIPPELGNLTNLSSLYLPVNNLIGTIPGELGNLTNLTVLSLYQNNLSGCYDANLANLCNIQVDIEINNEYENNNFDATWSDFCNTGAGTCSLPGASCRERDSLALVALYNTTDGPNWTTTWDLTQPMDTWHGVTLNQEGCVFLLFLPSNGLTGPIPIEFSDLMNVREVDLGNNNLTGTIPGELGNLFDDLEDMILTNNNLSGCFHPNLINWCSGPSLPRVDLDIGNNFDATLWDFCTTGAGTCLPPQQPCRQRDSLILADFYNSLSNIAGLTWNINQPMNTWNGVTLNADGCVTVLDIQDLGWTGTIPPEMGDLSELTLLNFDENDVQGTIPSELGNLTNLTYLNLSTNSISGTIPPELGQLTNLVELILSANALTGDIPVGLGNLTNLTRLDFGNNNLTGNIPGGLGNLANLTWLRLAGNNMTGCYDPNLANWCGQLSTAFIDGSNNFDVTWQDFCNTGAGTCIVNPCRQSDSLTLVTVYHATGGANWTETWNLNQPMDTWHGVTLSHEGCVIDLDLSANGLTGTIAVELADLRSIIELNLSVNNFTGGIPGEFGDMTNLYRLNVAGNNLTGCFDQNLANLCGRALGYGSINYFNNFDATWEDFCYTGTGVCNPVSCRERDSLALASLYHTTDGANWAHTWNLAQPINTWYGVTLTPQGCVSELNLTANQLNGPFPVNFGAANLM